MSIGPSATDSVTSLVTGEDLDQLRTAIQALQLYAEGTTTTSSWRQSTSAW
jgi:hypothetical protein